MESELEHNQAWRKRVGIINFLRYDPNCSFTNAVYQYYWVENLLGDLIDYSKMTEEGLDSIFLDIDKGLKG